MASGALNGGDGGVGPNGGSVFSNHGGTNGSGGGSDGHGGGGGSFDTSANPILLAGVRAGNGDIMITLIASKFAGTPGAADCQGKSVSALARQFGGLSNAATTLGFANVAALQTGISTFCQK